MVSPHAVWPAMPTLMAYNWQVRDSAAFHTSNKVGPVAMAALCPHCRPKAGRATDVVTILGTKCSVLGLREKSQLQGPRSGIRSEVSFQAFH